MSWVANQARNDDAADAAQFLSRFGYVLIALGVPAGVVLHELAIFVLYPVAVASFVLAALIDPPGGATERMRRAFAQPIVALSLALIAWAGVSVLWTPFSIAAGQHLLKLALWLVSLFLILDDAARPCARHRCLSVPVRARARDAGHALRRSSPTDTARKSRASASSTGRSCW